MVENHPSTVREWDSVSQLGPILTGVPGSKPATGIGNDTHPLKSFRPVVQIALIAALAILTAIMAPLEAALAPPLERRKRARILAECDPTSVEGSIEHGPVGPPRREAMGDEHD